MWYVLQTMTGNEEKLADIVKRVVPAEYYEKCFVVYYERVWRKQKRSIVHVERLFPGYVFIITNDPDKIFLELKTIPTMASLLSDGEFHFLHLNIEEVRILQELLQDQDNGNLGKVVKLSYVETDARGNIYQFFGPLKSCKAKVIKYQLKKRYAVVRFQMFGIEKTVVLGIILKEDVQQGIIYGKAEMPAEVSGFSESEVAVGDYVKVMIGISGWMDGVIRRKKENSIEVGVQLFGQEILVEVAKDQVYKD